MAKIGHDAKPRAFAKWSFQVKNLKCEKGAEKEWYEHIRVVVCNKPLQKTRNIRKKEHFDIGQGWLRRKGYSLCKMVSLGQKLKMPKRCEKQLYEHIKFFLCQKALQNTPNVREMTPF